MEQTVDIAVAGGGMAGLSFAAAVRTLAPALPVTVIDAPSRASGDERWSAISAAGRRLFEAVGAWDALAGAAQPIHRMVIGVARPEDPVKPADLVISGEVGPGEPFAHMVSNTAILAALRDRVNALGGVVRTGRVADLELRPGFARLHLAEASPLDAKLVVAADGGRSAVRSLAGFRTVAWPYRQSAFVVTVSAGRPHDGTALQVFLPEGPIAALPIPGQRFCIVWSADEAEIGRILALDDGALAETLNERLGRDFGDFKVEGSREAFPLRLEVSRDLVRERVALLGDAAHVIHPLAGQALNLGFKDAAVLAEELKEAVELGLDPGSETVLLNYERRRRFDTVAMATVTDGLNRLLSGGGGLLRPVLGFGMQIFDRLGPLKDRMVREAAGVEGDLPLLLRARDGANGRAARSAAAG
jgi:2-octaprenyl-6-methoxyphenol hydroxylase